MPRRIRGTKERRATFLREWREYRQLTLEQAASRFDMSGAQLSRVETGKSPYTQDLLELAVDAYSAPDVVSLLIRNPKDPDAIWSIWDQAKPAIRQQIVEISKTLIKTGTK